MGERLGILYTSIIVGLINFLKLGKVVPPLSILSQNALTQAIICVKQHNLRSVNIQQDSIQNVILETSGNKIPLVLSGLFFLLEDPEPPPRE